MFQSLYNFISILAQKFKLLKQQQEQITTQHLEKIMKKVIEIVEEIMIFIKAIKKKINYNKISIIFIIQLDDLFQHLYHFIMDH